MDVLEVLAALAALGKVSGAFAPGAGFEPTPCLAAGLPFSILALAVVFVAAPAGTLAVPSELVAVLGCDAAVLAAAVGLTGAFSLVPPDALAAVFAVVFTGPLAAAGLEILAGAALEDFWATTAALAGALEATAGTAFFWVTALLAVRRAEASVAAAAAFLDDSPAVLATAAFADALEAFAFTTAPFFVSAGTTVVGTTAPSCRSEGDRR